MLFDCELVCIPLDAGLTAVLEAALSPGTIFTTRNQLEPGYSQPVADSGTGQPFVVAVNATDLDTFSNVLADLLKPHATYLQILASLTNGSVLSPPPQDCASGQAASLLAHGTFR
jgi:hypothetical protein